MKCKKYKLTIMERLRVCGLVCYPFQNHIACEEEAYCLIHKYIELLIERRLKRKLK